MRSPFDERPKTAALRRRAAQAAKQQYPAGRALGRIEFFETQRGLPQTTYAESCVIPVDAEAPRILKRAQRKRHAPKTPVYAAANRAKARFSPSFAASANLPTWRSLGPNLIPRGQTYGTGGNNRPSVSGRCVGIVVSPTDPDHLVVCSAGGGLWESLDQGSCWRALTDSEPTLSMGAIASAPSSPNIVYAGTGEGDTFSKLGLGLLRSADGGATWQLVASNALAGDGIYDIEVDPTDPLHLWVSTTNKLLESSDGGGSWQVVQPVMTWDVSINPLNASEVFAATAAGLIRSTNGGQSWTRVALRGTSAGTRFSRMEVCHAPSRSAIVYVVAAFGGGAAMWRRGRTGGRFSTQKTPNLKPDSDIRQAWFDWCFGVSPADPNVVYWGAVELYKGSRGSSGFRWRNISSRSSGDSIHADQHHIAFDPSDPNVVYVCNDGGIYRSPNGGRNWHSLNPGLDITEFEFIAHLESEDEWLIGGTQDNGTLAYKVAREWKQIALGDGGDCGSDENQNLCYHSYYSMWIERAAALGTSAFRWRDVSPPFGPSYDALFYPPMEVKDNIVTKAGITLFVSEDNGLNWDDVSFGGGGARASALAIVGTNRIFVGTEDGQLILVTRGRGGWQNPATKSLTRPVNGYISDIAVPGSASRVIWVSCSTFGRAHVLRSLNGGSNWSDRSRQLPDIPVNAIVVDPTNRSRVFAASDHGVYRTETSGGTWTYFSNGLPNVVVGDIILHERLRLLRVGTRSRGIWEIAI